MWLKKYSSRQDSCVESCNGQAIAWHLALVPFMRLFSELRFAMFSACLRLMIFWCLAYSWFSIIFLLVAAVRVCLTNRDGLFDR